MFRKTFIILILSFFLTEIFIIKNSAANDNKLYEKHQSDLVEIEKYFNNIHYLYSEFIQKSPKNTIDPSQNYGEIKGELLLSRPGKLKVEYYDPNPIKIVVNGSVLEYTDKELEETSYLSTNSTPASFLTRKNFSFKAQDLEIIDFQKNQAFIKVAIAKKNKKDAGTFSLIFETNPLKFSKMEVVNDLGEITQVSLTNPVFGKKIDDNLFTIKSKNLPQ